MTTSSPSSDRFVSFVSFADHLPAFYQTASGRSFVRCLVELLLDNPDQFLYNPEAKTFTQFGAFAQVEPCVQHTSRVDAVAV